MKKALFVLLAIVAVVGFGVKDSVAGQLCWRTEDNTVFKLVTGLPDPAYPWAKSLNGVWIFGGFAVPVTGSMVKSPYGTQLLINLDGTLPNMSTHYGMRGHVGPVSKNGTITIYHSNTGGFDTEGLTKVSCKSIEAVIADLRSEH